MAKACSANACKENTDEFISFLQKYSTFIFYFDGKLHF